MIEVIGIASKNGRRVELVLRVEDEQQAALAFGDVRERLTLLLNREADRAATVLFVAEQDEAEARQLRERPKRAANAGPNQIAFAGSDEAAEIDKDGAEIRRMKAGKPASNGEKARGNGARKGR